MSQRLEWGDPVVKLVARKLRGLGESGRPEGGLPPNEGSADYQVPGIA